MIIYVPSHYMAVSIYLNILFLTMMIFFKCLIKLAKCCMFIIEFYFILVCLNLLVFLVAILSTCVPFFVNCSIFWIKILFLFTFTECLLCSRHYGHSSIASHCGGEVSRERKITTIDWNEHCAWKRKERGIYLPFQRSLDTVIFKLLGKTHETFLRGLIINRGYLT